jgi:hypothetical protein
MGYPRIKILPEAEEIVDDFLEGNNLGMRGFDDGAPHLQRNGKIAEVSVYKVLKGVYPDLKKQKKNHSDGGLDIPYRDLIIDAKSKMSRGFAKPHFCGNIRQCQMGKSYAANTYIFCQVNTVEWVVEICGWISKVDFLKTATLYYPHSYCIRDNGSKFIINVPSYFIQYKFLNEFKFLL